MRFLVTGARGLLGKAVMAALEQRGHEATGLGHAEFDLTNLEHIAQIGMNALGPFEWCINCAAIPDVDVCEANEQLAAEVNGLGVGYLGQACAQAGVKLVHVSTDYVFDGTATEPYREDAKQNPINAYGRSKLLAERALEGRPLALIVRTGVLFGGEGSMSEKLIAAAKAGTPIKASATTIGNPTYVPELARVLVELAEKNAFPGIYHAAGPEAMSRLEFAQRVLAAAGLDASVEAFTEEEEASRVPRPKYIALADTRLEAAGVKPVSNSLSCLSGRGLG